jgi:hypothetical protein
MFSFAMIVASLLKRKKRSHQCMHVPIDILYHLPKRLLAGRLKEAVECLVSLRVVFGAGQPPVVFDPLKSFARHATQSLFGFIGAQCEIDN